MKIYLMRHGEAVSPSEWPEDDMSRPLSALGEAKLETAVKKMHDLGFSPSHLITSPFARTRQTADIINNHFTTLNPVVVQEFASGSSLSTLKAGVEKFKDKESLWVVGHMPDLAILGSRITTIASVGERSLSPGEILALEMDLVGKGWGDGKILWYRRLDEWAKLKQLDS
jgi:phosphohistidine phosphatase